MRWSLVVFVIVSASCVSNRKVTLLQSNDVDPKPVSIDTVLRTYGVDHSDYRIQTNDLLSIKFESITQEEFDFLSGPSTPGTNPNVTPLGALLIGELVDEDGNIPFPVLGKVKVAGQTIFEIQNRLQEIANDYLESPVVKVRLLNFRFTILGEVPKEGTITLSNNRVSMIEAIGYAGGLGELADRAKIKLIRQKSDGTMEVQYVNLLDERFVSSPYYYVHQNDILIVPALRQRPFRKYFGQNLSLIVSTISLLLLAFNLSR